MHWSTTVIQEEPDRLSKREWRFCIFEGVQIKLDFIGDYERSTIRHKYRCIDSWGCLDRREDTMLRIEPPESVKEEVRNRILTELTFV